MTPRSVKAIRYAEDTLGVHAVWKEAQDRFNSHKWALEVRSKLLDSIREVKQDIDAVELDIVTNAGTLFPHAKSKTELQELTKLELRSNTDLRNLNDRLSRLQTELSQIDGSIRHHEAGLKMLAARMNELSGLLVFYAESMRSESA